MIDQPLERGSPAGFRPDSGARVVMKKDLAPDPCRLAGGEGAAAENAIDEQVRSWQFTSVGEVFDTVLVDTDDNVAPPGMVAVFEVMAISGSGNPRSMASGVSMATIPTMAGMVAALSGVAMATYLQRKAARERELLSDHLVIGNK